MRPRKEHLPCGISKIHLKRAHPERQEDESGESGISEGPSSLNSPDKEAAGVGIGQGETGDLASPVPLSCPPPPRKHGRCPLLKSLPPPKSSGT